jgi:L-cysteine:1D-myo-inositol 2-amino-2-deoxy-alpha-D-glucopyranoside ligase
MQNSHDSQNSLKLKLFDSNSGKIKPFVSLEEGKVKMYVCGVTPYANDHLGHIFVFLQFDILWRLFELLGYEVEYVQNITDIDQPLFEKAREEGKDWRELAEYWVDYMLDDFKTLGIRKPKRFIYASDYLESMIKVIKQIEENGCAYRAGGNVYFDTQAYGKYGENIDADYDKLLELSAGEYGGHDINDPNKKDQLDFPLWIGKKNIDQADPTFPSPFGEGIPGWHIECSSMIIEELGEQIDIHGGGSDLKFPHHGAEIAQAQCYSGEEPFVNHWMHVGMVKYEGHKISKSRGNLVSVQEIIQEYDPQLLRFYLATHHYRESWEFSYDALGKAKEDFEQFMEIVTDSKIKKEELASEEMLSPEIINDLNIRDAVSRVIKEQNKVGAQLIYDNFISLE